MSSLTSSNSKQRAQEEFEKRVEEAVAKRIDAAIEQALASRPMITPVVDSSSGNFGVNDSTNVIPAASSGSNDLINALVISNALNKYENRKYTMYEEYATPRQWFSDMIDATSSLVKNKEYGKAVSAFGYSMQKESAKPTNDKAPGFSMLEMALVEAKYANAIDESVWKNFVLAVGTAISGENSCKHAKATILKILEEPFNSVNAARINANLNILKREPTLVRYDETDVMNTLMDKYTELLTTASESYIQSKRTSGSTSSDMSFEFFKNWYVDHEKMWMNRNVNMHRYVLYPRTGSSMGTGSMIAMNAVSAVQDSFLPHPVAMHATHTTSKAPSTAKAAGKKAGGACHQLIGGSCLRENCKYSHDDADVDAEVLKMRKLIKDKRPALASSDVDAMSSAVVMTMFKLIKDSNNYSVFNSYYDTIETCPSPRPNTTFFLLDSGSEVHLLNANCTKFGSYQSVHVKVKGVSGSILFKQKVTTMFGDIYLSTSVKLNLMSLSKLEVQFNIQYASGNCFKLIAKHSKRVFITEKHGDFHYLAVMDEDLYHVLGNDMKQANVVSVSQSTKQAAMRLHTAAYGTGSSRLLMLKESTANTLSVSNGEIKQIAGCSCAGCLTHQVRQQPQASLQPSLPGSVDLEVDLLEFFGPNGKQWLLQMISVDGGLSIAYSMPHKTVQCMAQGISHCVTRYTSLLPFGKRIATLTSDNESALKVCADEVGRLLKLHCVFLKPGHHAHKVERRNLELRTKATFKLHSLRALGVEVLMSHWQLMLQNILQVENMLPHSDTGVAPYQALTERTFVHPLHWTRVQFYDYVHCSRTKSNGTKNSFANAQDTGIVVGFDLLHHAGEVFVWCLGDPITDIHRFSLSRVRVIPMSQEVKLKLKSLHAAEVQNCANVLKKNAHFVDGRFECTPVRVTASKFVLDSENVSGETKLSTIADFTNLTGPENNVTNMHNFGKHVFAGPKRPVGRPRKTVSFLNPDEGVNAIPAPALIQVRNDDAVLPIVVPDNGSLDNDDVVPSASSDSGGALITTFK